MNYRANSERYSNMVYNRCGESGLKLPAVSLGLWHNFGDSADFCSVKAKTQAILHGLPSILTQDEKKSAFSKQVRIILLTLTAASSAMGFSKPVRTKERDLLSSALFPKVCCQTDISTESPPTVVCVQADSF